MDVTAKAKGEGVMEEHLCLLAAEPRPGRECYEACWSLGRSCRFCQSKCYRNGWDAARVMADNKRLVEETLRVVSDVEGEG